MSNGVVPHFPGFGTGSDLRPEPGIGPTEWLGRHLVD
jgi:hypothetical protein